MVTVGDFRESVTRLMSYIFITERDEFVENMEHFELDGTSPANHILLDAFVVYNALREADGEPTISLAEFIDEVTRVPGPLFICTNTECGYIGTKTDPLMQGQLLDLSPNDPMPAGGCPHCGGIVRAV